MPLALINEDAEHERARRWRTRIVLLKVEQLAALIPYTWGAIYRFERGEAPGAYDYDYNPPKLIRRPVTPGAWRRYKLCCAAVHAQIHGWTKGRAFDWRL